MKVVGDRLDESPRVGMQGPPQNIGGCTLLHDPTRVHHRDAIGKARDDCEIVGDVDHRKPPVCTKPTELVEDPRLGHDVEPCSGLVEDDEWWFAGE